MGGRGGGDGGLGAFVFVLLGFCGHLGDFFCKISESTKTQHIFLP